MLDDIIGNETILKDITKKSSFIKEKPTKNSMLLPIIHEREEKEGGLTKLKTDIQKFKEDVDRQRKEI